MKRALVLSGGGARGAYQMGVYKALQKMKINIDIITGTSIGALNGCMFVQGDYKKALKMWESLSFSSVLENAEKIYLDTIQGKKELFSQYIAALVKSGGFDIKKIEETVESAFDHYKFYSSDIDFGLVTVRANDLKPILLTKDELKPDVVMDYLVASAAIFPAFSKKKIENQDFIDGGYYDNLPIELAVKMGATEVVAVDLETIGKKRNVDSELVDIKIIRPTTKLGNFLNFDGKLTKKYIDIGFNDCMKAYGKFEGNKYTFKKRHLYYNKLAYEQNFKKNIDLFASFKTRVGNAIKEKVYLKYIEGDYDEYIPKVLDFLGDVFDLDESKVYGVFKFNNEIRTKFTKIYAIDYNKVSNIFDTKKLESLTDKKMIIKYIYNQLESRNNEKLNVAAAVFPLEYVASVYLYTIYN